MAQTGFTCTLTTADKPACRSYARITVTDTEGATARGCPDTPSSHSTAATARTSSGPPPKASTSGSDRPST
jgi:hypothetical protein